MSTNTKSDQNCYTSVAMHGDANGTSPVEMNSMKDEEAEKGCRNCSSNGRAGETDRNSKEMRVYYTGSSSRKLFRGRLQTKLEQYLVVLCVLLICVGVAFMVLAFIRHRTGELFTAAAAWFLISYIKWKYKVFVFLCPRKYLAIIFTLSIRFVGKRFSRSGLCIFD